MKFPYGVGTYSVFEPQFNAITTLEASNDFEIEVSVKRAINTNARRIKFIFISKLKY